MIFEYTNRESKSLQHLLVVRLISIKRTMQYKKKKKKKNHQASKNQNNIDYDRKNDRDITQERERERMKRLGSKFVGTRRNSGCWTVIGELICYLSV